MLNSKLFRFAAATRLASLGLAGALLYSGQAIAMDLLQAYDAAQQADATILAARAAAQAERERLPQAKSQLYPNLSASISATKNKLYSETPNFLGNMQEAQTNYPSRTRSLTLRQPLYRPQLLVQYRQAKSLVDDAEAALNQEQQNLATRVAGSYFEALLAQQQRALIERQKTAYQAQWAQASKAFVAGSATRTDIDEARARLDMNHAQEIEARQNVAYTLQQLQTLVNQNVNQLAALDPQRLQLKPAQPDDLPAWIARAERHSPQLESLRARVEAARLEAEKARASHYPTLDAVLQYADSRSESVTNTSSRYINNSLGLQLNVPLYSGGYINSLVRQTLAALERAEQNLEAGRRDLGLRVAKEFRGIGENMARVQALEQALRSADQLLISAQKSLKAGNRTIVDVLNAEQQRTLVQHELAQARYMYLISDIRLMGLVGAADRELMVRVNAVFNASTLGQ